MLSLSSATTQATDQADALKMTEAARSDPTHALWGMTPEQQREIYLKAFPGPLPAPVGPAEGAPAPPAPVTPAAPPPDSLEAIERDTAELVARAKRQPAPLSEEEGLRLVERRRALSGAQDVAPTEQPPVPVADADLPPITLPEGVSADDPTVRAVRQLALLAEVAPPAVEGLVAHVHGLLQTEPPDEETYWKQSDAAMAAAQQKYGPRFNAFLDAVQRGRSFVEEHEPALVEVLEDPLVQKDLRTAEILAHIGSQGRRLYVRKYGTKPLFRV